MNSLVRGFFLLSNEALLDAVRRRIVFVIALVSVLSLMFVDSCTARLGGEVIVNGRSANLAALAGWTGLLTFLVLALWTLILAGILASEHLARTLGDGSGVLVLARPIGRGTFALARLTGVFVIAMITSIILLGGTAFFLIVRNGLPAGPALLGAFACWLGALVVAALAMAGSLFLPRVATAIGVLVFVGAVSLGNLISLFGTRPDGLLGVLDRVGPPLCSSIVLATSGWISEVTIPVDPVAVAGRLLLWVVASVALLIFLFRRIEVEG